MEDTNTGRAPHCPTCSCATGGAIPWRPVVAVLLFVAAWDTIGLLVGDRFYASPSYDVLRDIGTGVSFLGWSPGIRLYGILLLVAATVLTWLLLAQRRRDGSLSRLLSFALSSLAAYWVTWCAGITASFLYHGQIYAWGSLGKLLGVAAIAVIAAKVPPPRPCPPAVPGAG
jgi:hypothetical protein